MHKDGEDNLIPVKGYVFTGMCPFTGGKGYPWSSLLVLFSFPHNQ